MNILDSLKDFFDKKRVLILGYGLEGKSTLRMLEKLGCAGEIAVSDKTDVNIAAYKTYSGENYFDAINDYDIVMKAPGVVLLDKLSPSQEEKITSQTDLFLRFSQNLVIGVTGTKGKSTTSSLINHILRGCNIRSRLIGNIGVPAFDAIEPLSNNVVYVYELSCHQLEYVKSSPNIAILLNIYEEHLDHYVDFEAYKYAKHNIHRFQTEKDLFIDENAIISFMKDLPPLPHNLPGEHNNRNITAALAAVYAAEKMLSFSHKIEHMKIAGAVQTFRPLPHRLEKIAEIGGVTYVNDSISTIPDAAIAAVKAFPGTDTLIVGGMDRGISYDVLTDFLNTGAVKNVITLPDSGERVVRNVINANIYRAETVADAVKIAKEVTKKCCIFSPAAASYGFYKNFEERGKDFTKNVLLL